MLISPGKTLLVVAIGTGVLTGFAAPPGPAQDKVEFVLQDKPQRLDPFRDTRLQLNPPTFRWPGAKVGVSYRIELSREADFAHPTTVIVHDLFYRPLEPLATGTWYWRCRAETPTPGAWLGPESFAVTSELASWTVPDWGDLLRRVPPTHPRIFLRAAEVPAIRANARRLAAPFARWTEKTRQELTTPFVIEEFMQRVPADADPNDAGSQGRKKLVWASRAAAEAIAHSVADGAWIWLATGDPWFLEATRQRALVAAGLDPRGFITERNSADVGNLDFGNAALVGSLGEVYDLLHDELTVDERRQIRAAIVARAAPMFEKLKRAPLNLMRGHGWQRAYLEALTGALAVLGEEPIAAEWAELGAKAFVALYPWFGGNDGGSQEGTKYYHGLEMIPSLETLDVFRSAFGLRLEEGNPWFRANPYFLLYSFPPNSAMAKLGDSFPGEHNATDDRPTPGGMARIAAWRMAELHGNGHCAAYAALLPADDDAGVTVAQFLRWSNPPTVAPVSLATLPPARLFSDVGSVFTHSDYLHPEANVRLVFHSTPYGGHGHAHADQNSFHLIAYNEELLLDSGYYTPTGDPHRQEWSVQTKAHNTILVDGLGQSWGDTRGYGRITHFEQHADWVYFVGRAEQAYPQAPLARFDRHIVWLRGTDVETYVIIDDLVAADGAGHRFDWLLHAASRMETDAAAKTIKVRGQKSEAVITLLEPAALAFHQDDRFDAPAIYWRNGRNYPLPNQWHLKATPPAAPQARFVAVIQVSKPGVAKPPLRGLDGGVDAAGWRVQLQAGQHRVSVTPAP